MNWSLKEILPPAVLVALGLGYLLLRKRPPTLVSVLSPEGKRALVVQSALGEVGSNNTSKYWNMVAPGAIINKGTAWCGAFALWSLKEVGLAKNWFWQFGKGFLYQLPITHNPQPGDIAYVDKPYQHHAVVHTVNSDGTVNLINGNGTDGKVSLSTQPTSHITAFYSIEPLVNV